MAKPEYDTMPSLTGIAVQGFTIYYRSWESPFNAETIQRSVADNYHYDNGCFGYPGLFMKIMNNDEGKIVYPQIWVMLNL